MAKGGTTSRQAWARRLCVLGLPAGLWLFAATGGADSPAGLPDRVRPPSAATYTRFAVASDNFEASKAGRAVLEAGGNAADAAAATMLALGVASPQSSGLGGGGFALYYKASDRSVHFLDFRERAPAAATETMFDPSSGAAADASRKGGLAVGVPGEAAGIELLTRRFGQLSLARITAPALALARRGSTVTPYMATLSSRFADTFTRMPSMRRWLTRGHTGLTDGQRLRRPELVRALTAISRGDIASFYRGTIAREIVRSVRAAGGVMTLQDLRDYRVEVRDPLVRRVFGRDFATVRAPSAGGVGLIAGLSMLERTLRPGASEGDQTHALAEAFKGIFVDRQRYFGDPYFNESVSEDALLAPARIEGRARLYDQERARPAMDYAFPLGANEASAPLAVPTGSGTSHFCVVDAEGNVASVTTTINGPYGAGVEAAGILLNNEMDDFASAVDAPNGFELPGGARNLPRPGRRPVSSMSPTIVLEDGLPVLCIGGSGGSRIITAVAQVARRILVENDSPEAAIAHPRMHHQGMPDRLDVENPAAVGASMQARGHTVAPMTFAGHVQAIRIRRTPTRTLEAASDARKDGAPSGI